MHLNTLEDENQTEKELEAIILKLDYLCMIISQKLAIFLKPSLGWKENKPTEQDIDQIILEAEQAMDKTHQEYLTFIEETEKRGSIVSPTELYQTQESISRCTLQYSDQMAASAAADISQDSNGFYQYEAVTKSYFTASKEVVNIGGDPNDNIDFDKVLPISNANEDDLQFVKNTIVQTSGIVTLPGFSEREKDIKFMQILPFAKRLNYLSRGQQVQLTEIKRDFRIIDSCHSSLIEVKSLRALLQSNPLIRKSILPKQFKQQIIQNFQSYKQKIQEKIFKRKQKGKKKKPKNIINLTQFQ